MKQTILYARVSTTDKGQNPEMQLSEMRAFCSARGWQIVTEAVDICSGAKEVRPELNRLMGLARKRAIDAVIVWKLDRFGRSLKHLVNSIAEFEALGIAFISIRDQIDMTTPAGRLQFHILSAMAEFERDLIVERVRAGIAQARMKGTKSGKAIGRPQSLTPSRTTLWRRQKATEPDYLAEI
jgi:DNA invertase Pin-like site-specific DNA recombinase